MGSDQLFKVILRGLLREFLELFFPDFAARLDFGSMRFPDRELFKGFPDGSRREPDVVAEVQSLAGDREIVVVHVEVQTEAEEDFKRRMFEYYSLLWLHFDAPVFPIALILRRGPREGISTVQYRRNVFGREVVRFQFACVALARLSGWEYLEKGPLAAGLAALMRRRRAPADLDLRAGLLQRVLTSELDESVRSPLVNLVETYFPLNDEEWKRFRQLIAREEYRGMQDVELTYFDKLRQEGLVRGKQETLKRLLAAKFGPLPSTLEARIDTIDAVAELDDYLLRLLSAGSLAEMGLQG